MEEEAILQSLGEVERRKEMLLQMIENSKRDVRLVRLISCIILTISISISLFTLFGLDNQKYFRKDEVKEKINQLIRNGGDIESVKHLYENRVCVPEYETLFLSDEKKFKNYYKKEVNLNIILQDLMTDYYLNKDSICDSLLYINLTSIISQNEAKNPFESLEKNQKYYFINIQSKLNSEEYSNIHSDVMKIADELKSKNGLVNKYLNKSEISFYISIAAIFITIILSAFQMIQSHLSNKKMENYLNSMMKKDE